MNATVNCPQCRVKYSIDLKKPPMLYYFIDMIDRTIDSVCPLFTLGVITGTAYATTVAYGAVAICQFLGYKEGIFLFVIF